jgi:hypothetical protein
MFVTFEQSSSIRFWHIESEMFSWFGQIRPTWASFENGISAHKDLSKNSCYSFHESRSLRMLMFVTKCFSSIFHSPSKLRNQGQNAKRFPVFCSTKYLAEWSLISSLLCEDHTLVRAVARHIHEFWENPTWCSSHPRDVTILVLDISKINRAGELKW